MLMAAGTNAEGFLNTPSAIKHTTAPGLGGEAEGTPDPPPQHRARAHSPHNACTLCAARLRRKAR